MSTLHLSVSDLRKAANLKERIEALEKELTNLLDAAVSTVSTLVNGPAKKKRGMSAAGRARIIAAQKARWARVHAANGGAKPKRKKRGMSAEGRARIIAAQKARWAKVRAGKSK